MTTIVLTVGFFAAAMAMMAMGVILSNRELHGSCGGTGKDCVCEIEKRRACAQFKAHKKGGGLASSSIDMGLLGSDTGRDRAWTE
jgi:hypothetical protein